MKKQITILLLMSILILTACSKEPQESIGASEVMEQEKEKNIVEREEIEEAVLADKQWITEDFIRLMKSCEDQFKIMDGSSYDCDILVETQGYMYSYEFPEEENIVADNCRLVFDYDNLEMASDNESSWVAVNLVMGEKEFLIGGVRFDFECIGEQEYTIRDTQYNYNHEDEKLNYRKNSYREMEDSVIIRGYDEKNRTVELCYVTEVDYDMSIGYQMEKEEWITVPLADEVNIISWSQGNNSSCFISEEILYNLIDYFQQYDFYFAWISVEDGEIVCLEEVLNP